MWNLQPRLRRFVRKVSVAWAAWTAWTAWRRWNPSADAIKVSTILGDECACGVGEYATYDDINLCFGNAVKKHGISMDREQLFSGKVADEIHF